MMMLIKWMISWTLCLSFAITDTKLSSSFTIPIIRIETNRFSLNHLKQSSSLLDSVIELSDITSLPIYNILNDVQSSLKSKPNLLLQASPGAGKTSLVPICLSFTGKVIVVQPRRVATRSAAHRMSNLLHEPIGTSVGYAIRGESHYSSDTKVLVMTDGVLLNMLRRDPELKGYNTVILDEFHERGVGSDTALVLLREAQCNYREDLKIVVMSATLLGGNSSDGEETMKSKLTRVLGGNEHCAVLQSEGRQYPISLQYASRGDPPLRALVRDTKLLVQTMADAIEVGILKAPDKGDVLAFLPGAKEIRLTAKELKSRKLNVDIYELYGALSRDDQDRAIFKSQHGRRKVVVSSPIAEASLTIEGVSCVVDSGLQRQPKYDASTGLPHLVTATCSKDSIIQRGGRAGRTREGYCIRLFTELEYENLAIHATPEICSTDLVPTTLLLTEWGCTSATEILEELSFVDSPPKESLDKAYQMLVDLEALEEYKLPNDIQRRYKVTRHGDAIVSLPTHPRFASSIIKAAEMTMELLAAAVTAAALSEDVIDMGGRESNLALNVRNLLKEGPNSYNGKKLINFASRLSEEAKSAVLNALTSLEMAIKVSECVGLALLPGFIDLIAQRKGDASYGGSTYMLALGQSARLDRKSDEGEYLIVVDTSTGDDGKTRIYSYAKIDAFTLESVAVEKEEVYAVASKGYEVRKRKVRKVGSLVLSASTLPSPSSYEVTQVLLDTIESIGGVSALLDMQSKREKLKMEEFLQRVNLARQSSCDEDWPVCFAGIDAIINKNSSSKDERIVVDVIEPWLGAAASLKGINLFEILTAELSPDHKQQLDDYFPENIAAPDGSIIPVAYDSDGGAVAIAKLQQFFGQSESPKVGPPGKKTSLSLSLLSPSGKPLAQTRDLTFFWKEVYPSIRAEMRGRYPKHPWPEDPLAAVATRMTKKQAMQSTETTNADTRKERSKQKRKR